jgi:putative transposase
MPLTMLRKFKKTPPRLSTIFSRYDPPLFLITMCTLLRRPILCNPTVHDAFRTYAQRGQQFGVAVGRYVIMPDHLHAFVCFGGEVGLRRWVKGLKRHLDTALLGIGQTPAIVPDAKLSGFWQPGTFDHLLRNDESYAQKWNYVRDNPVRAKLVERSEDWPNQGEIVLFDRV